MLACHTAFDEDGMLENTQAKRVRTCAPRACTGCRLSKVKCEQEGESGECIRCSRLGLSCIFQCSKRGQSNPARDVARLGPAVRALLDGEKGMSHKRDALARKDLQSSSIELSALEEMLFSPPGSLPIAAEAAACNPLSTMEKALGQAEKAAIAALNHGSQPYSRRASLSRMLAAVRGVRVELSGLLQEAPLSTRDFEQEPPWGRTVSLDMEAGAPLPLVAQALPVATTTSVLSHPLGSDSGSWMNGLPYATAIAPHNHSGPERLNCATTLALGAARAPGAAPSHAPAVPHVTGAWRMPPSSTDSSTEPANAPTVTHSILATPSLMPTACLQPPRRCTVPTSVPPSPPEPTYGMAAALQEAPAGDAIAALKTTANSSSLTPLPLGQPFDILATAMVSGLAAVLMTGDAELRHAAHVAQLIAFLLLLVALSLRLSPRRWVGDALLPWVLIFFAFPLVQCSMDVQMQPAVLHAVMSKVQSSHLGFVIGLGFCMGGAVHFCLPRPLWWRCATAAASIAMALIGAGAASWVQFSDVRVLPQHYLSYYLGPFVAGFAMTGGCTWLLQHSCQKAQ